MVHLVTPGLIAARYESAELVTIYLKQGGKKTEGAKKIKKKGDQQKKKDDRMKKVV